MPALRQPILGTTRRPFTAATAVTAITAAGALAASLAVTASPALAATDRPLANRVDEGVRRAVQAKPLPQQAASITGTVVRVAIEAPARSTTKGSAKAPQSSSTPGAVATWVVGDAGRVQVPASQLAGVPTGSVITARLGRPVKAAAAAPVARAESGRALASQPRLLTKAAGSAGTAPHRATIALVNPPGGVADSMTTTKLQNVVENEVSGFWSEQTGGRLTVSVTKAQGWLNTAAGCQDYLGLWQEVAAKTGFTPAAGNHLILYITTKGTPSGCGAGLGTVGGGLGSGGYLYVRDIDVDRYGQSYLPALLAHELGHNVSLGHSNGLQCPSAADGTYRSGGWNRDCRWQGYRDPYDVMGFSWEKVGSLSTLHAHRLGVLGTGQQRAVTAPVRATLVPRSGQRGLMSLRFTDPSGVVYAIEYRTPNGRDSWLGANYFNLPGGVLVRRLDPTDSGGTLLLDPTPSVSSSDWALTLAAGRSLATGSGRSVIKVLSTGSTSAEVLITVDGKAPRTVAAAAPPPSLRVPRPRP